MSKQNRNRGLQSAGEQIAYGGGGGLSSNQLDKLSFLDQMAGPLLTSSRQKEEERKQKMRQKNYQQEQQQLQNFSKNGKKNNFFMNYEDEDQSNNQDDDLDDTFDQSGFDFGVKKQGNKIKNQKNQNLKQQLKQQNDLMQQMIQEMKQNTDKQLEQAKQTKLQEREEMLRQEIQGLKKDLNQMQEQAVNQMKNPFQQQQMTPQNIQQLIKEAIQEQQMENQLQQLQQQQPIYPPQQQFMPPPPQYYYPPPQQQEYRPPPRRTRTPIIIDSPKMKSTYKTAQKSPTVKSPTMISSHVPSQAIESPKASTIIESPKATTIKSEIKPSTIMLSSVPSDDSKSSIVDNQDEIEKEFQRRKQVIEDYPALQTDACFPICKWLAEAIETPLKLLTNQKEKDLDITNINGGSTAKDFKQRTDIICTICESILQGLISHLDSFPEMGKFFLAISFTDKSYLPEGVMYAFALLRLEFHPIFGYLDNLDFIQREMLQAFFILINLFVANILARPYEHLKSFKDSQNHRKILKQVCSILYHTILEYFRKECKIKEQSWINVRSEVKTNPIQTQIPVKFANDDILDEKVSDKGTIEDLCSGLYKLEDLKDLFELQKGWHEQFVTQLDELLSKIDDQVYAVSESIKAKQNENQDQPNNDQQVNQN